jgi:glycosyltransferase involved in cell wall biosynthesis
VDISIIVCSLNRADQLALCLPAVSAAIAGAGPLTCEVVVVDNGSVDDTWNVLSSWASAAPHAVIRLLETRPGLSAARNAGVGAANGSLLLFTDDDCRLDPSYVATAWKAYSKEKKQTIIGGSVTLGDPADIPMSITRATASFRYERATRSARRCNISDPFMGCNMVVPAAAFAELGGFDERIGAGTRIPGGEDSDLFMRAYRANYSLVFEPGLTVAHFHGRRTAAEGEALNRNYSLGTGALYIKHGLHEPDLLLPLMWDLRDWIRDVRRGRNSFQPRYNFTYGQKLISHFRGALQYIKAGQVMEPTAPTPSRAGRKG